MKNEQVQETVEDYLAQLSLEGNRKSWSVITSDWFYYQKGDQVAYRWHEDCRICCRG